MAKTISTAKRATTKSTTAKPAAKAAAAKAPAKSAAASGAKAASGKTAAKKPAAPKTTKAVAAKASKATAAKAATPRAPAKSASNKAPARNAAGTSAAAKRAAKPAARAKAGGRPWHKSYPPGIATEIGEITDRSIADLMVTSCKKFADRPAFTCMGKTITFAELEEKSRHLAGYLQSKGLKKGARVALMMPNVLQYPVALMAVLRAGYTVVNVNPLYTPRELEHQLKDAGAEAIIILENFATALEKCIAKTDVKHVIVAAMGDMLGIKGVIVNLVVRRVKKMVPAWSLPGHVKFPQALKAGETATFKPADVGHDDIAFLQYTGGTTGVSKGAVLLHRNVLANVAQNAIWVEGAFLDKPKPARMVYVCALPLYHIYALTVNAIMGMQQGAENILIPNPRDIPACRKPRRWRPPTASTAATSPARSDCRCRQPKSSSATRTARTSQPARWGKSSSGGRRSWQVTGTAPTRRPK